MTFAWHPVHADPLFVSIQKCGKIKISRVTPQAIYYILRMCLGQTAGHPGPGDIVIKLPIKATGRLSKELEKRDMLIPADIILDVMVVDQADIPVNAIHMYSGLKADLYLKRDGDMFRQSAFQRRVRVDYGPLIGKVYIHSPEDLILYKFMYLGLRGQPKYARDVAAILRAKKIILVLDISQNGSLDWGWAPFGRKCWTALHRSMSRPISTKTTEPAFMRTGRHTGLPLFSATRSLLLLPHSSGCLVSLLCKQWALRSCFNNLLKPIPDKR